MKMTKVLVSYPLPDKYFEKIQALDGIEATKVTEKEKILEEITDAEILFDKDISKKEFNEAKELEWIQSPYVGVDMLLIEELVNSDIVVTSARGIHSSQVSDHVFAFILSFAREIPNFIENKKKNKWVKRHPFPFKPLIELKQKTLGVIGLGTIGREVARKGKCFKMNVLGVKNHPREIDYVDKVYGPEKTEKVIKESDFLVLCVPYTPETENLITKKELKEMKEDAYLINVARGEVIDEEALKKALKQKWIKAAAIDVANQEPIPEESELWEIENLMITPHVAGSTPDYWDRVYQIFKKNIESYQNNEELINVVNKKEGY